MAAATPALPLNPCARLRHRHSSTCINSKPALPCQPPGSGPWRARYPFRLRFDRLFPPPLPLSVHHPPSFSSHTLTLCRHCKACRMWNVDAAHAVWSNTGERRGGCLTCPPSLPRAAPCPADSACPPCRPCHPSSERRREGPLRPCRRPCRRQTSSQPARGGWRGEVGQSLAARQEALGRIAEQITSQPLGIHQGCPSLGACWAGRGCWRPRCSVQPGPARRAPPRLALRATPSSKRDGR